MSRYTLEIVGSPKDGKLAYALDALATIHGGEVVEFLDATAQPSYQRQCVNMVECEESLEREVEWLRKEFPETRFTLKEGIE